MVRKNSSKFRIQRSNLKVNKIISAAGFRQKIDRHIKSRVKELIKSGQQFRGTPKFIDFMNVVRRDLSRFFNFQDPHQTFIFDTLLRHIEMEVKKNSTTKARKGKIPKARKPKLKEFITPTKIRKIVSIKEKILKEKNKKQSSYRRLEKLEQLVDELITIVFTPKEAEFVRRIQEKELQLRGKRVRPENIINYLVEMHHVNAEARNAGLTFEEAINRLRLEANDISKKARFVLSQLPKKHSNEQSFLYRFFTRIENGSKEMNQDLDALAGVKKRT